MGYKRIACALLAAVLTLLTAGCAAEHTAANPTGAADFASAGNVSLSSNLFTHPDDTGKPEGLTDMTLEGYEKIAESDRLALYLREESASIRILNKRSGYVWGALREDQPEGLNKTWAAFANSIVSIKYYDEAGNIRQTGAGHAENSCVWHRTENGVICGVTFGTAGISLTVTLELQDDHIRFSLDDESIVESGEYLLAQVYFAPFLGATVEDEIGGYLFVPDGCGALLRFQKQRKYLSGFESRIYGSDYGIDNLFVVGDLNANRTNDFLKDTESVTLPVYGISHGCDFNALFGYVEQGAEYGAIFAEPAQTILNYNYAGACFLYRQIYQQPTGRDGAGIQVVQKSRNTVNPAVSVYFLEGGEANYNGMAHVCREILREQNLLTNRETEAPALKMDFLTADVREGFLFSSTASLTDAEDLLRAAEYLREQGIENMDVTLLGWQKGGLNGYAKRKVCTDTELGSLSDLAALQDRLAELDCGFSLYLAPLSVKDGQAAKTELGIALSQSVICVERNNDEVFLGDTMYLKTERALQTLTEQVKALREAGLTDITVDEISRLLYGEYLRDRTRSRTEVRELVVSGLTTLAEGEGLSLCRPNEYLLGLTGEYRNMPASCSRYVYETDSVPFLQLVLSGSMNLYAPYANQSFYTDMDVLKCIEYNLYPSFLLTGSDSGELRDTPSEEYFSTCFDDWKEIAVSVYQRVDGILRNVHGQTMVSHTVLAEGVIRTTWSGGGSIYVNYTTGDYSAGGITVPAGSAVYAGA